LGAHIDSCDSCGHLNVSYNSCRNRHCPKCQSSASHEWVQKQQESLLDVQYFHVVFTVPDSLNTLFMYNQMSCYNLLFKAASDTLLQLTKDPKHLGATIGFTSVLHTWGQNLSFHPHLHCIVTGGGLNELQNQFIYSKKKFLLPVRILSKVFRGKFLDYLKQTYLNHPIDFFFPRSDANPNEYFFPLINQLYSIDWVVYAKPTFKHSSAVIKYLGRYTHRIAISNSRILSMDNGLVSFKYKDYKDDNHQKIMTLSADEFIRRFLMHVLPSGFRKIRHYGILSNCVRKKQITLVRKLIGVSSFLSQLLLETHEPYQPICPVCKQGHLVFSHRVSHVRLLS